MIRNNTQVIKLASRGSTESSHTGRGPVRMQANTQPRHSSHEAATERLEICKSWIESKGRPPRPQWELLDRYLHFEPIDLGDEGG